jgi:hypothetical protein
VSLFSNLLKPLQLPYITAYKSIFAGKIQVSSSAAKIYIDMDIPEIKKYQARSSPMNL